MAKKLTDDEVTDLLHDMGDMLFTPDGEKVEALTTFGQARLDTDLRALLLAAAGEQRKQVKADLSVIEGGKD